MQVVHTRDCTIAWGASLYSIGSGSQAYSSILEEFPESYGDTVEDEYCILDLKGSWDEHLPLVEFAYNNSYQASIHMAPYEALYRRPCRSSICWTEVGERSNTGPEMISDTSVKVELIHKRLHAATTSRV